MLGRQPRSPLERGIGARHEPMPSEGRRPLLSDKPAPDDGEPH
jgi:hypothetical protein